ncbi:coproporphyrinogen III oxidase [Aerococcus urinaehominis]|uniref:Heme chaperone HemW n=1 Tax=Aerococcus urinaehominis TaxID=128944 RepID=A0A109RG98_9LACT|nr:radical SAM family heme chaperone HemW [Aerococcus urinaehominis]AMB98816.1 coproporphyrinogen III oxidase [Aerococcus urinaehominis]SDM49164.1 oxygen-independent coproporphyrinogen-3 oxidase [Aerococcus urinaehominis]
MDYQLLTHQADSRSIYIHIPFCSHICYYCDFNKVYIEGQPVDQYVDSLIREMQAYRDALARQPIETIYIGGGTPSTLTSDQLERLFTALNQLITLAPDYEFTFETNPNDITADKLETLKKVGVNRLSMGIQSFDDNLLEKIGRTHRAQQAIDAVKLAQEIGFDNISVDLIFRLPGQSLANFKASLDQALALDLPHYSIYSLILEQKTVFYNLMRQGKLPLPSQDEEADMFELAIQSMEKSGRHHYEISNYGKPGYESKHNLAYWDNSYYYGFGAGAHGYLNGYRYANHGPIQHYLKAVEDQGHAIIHERYLDRKQEIEEEMFLGLRKHKGVSRQVFKDRFGCDFYEDIYKDTIDHLLDQDLVVLTADRLYLTHHGMFIGNEVFQAFLIDEE